MLNHALNLKTAARFAIMHAEQLRFEDFATAMVGKEFVRVYQQIIGLRMTSLPHATAAVSYLMQDGWRKAIASLERALVDTGTWAYNEVYQIHVDELPEEYWSLLLQEANVDFSRAKDELGAKLLFNPPKRSEIMAIVLQQHPDGSGLTWKDRLNKLATHSITNEKQIADILAKGMSEGVNSSAIARRIQKRFGMPKYAAERIARTEANRVANEMKRKAYKQFDHIIAGYSLEATFDAATRPEHAARHGKMFIKSEYAAQFPGEAPLAELPKVPDAPNCRCTDIPIYASHATLFAGFSKPQWATKSSMFGQTKDPGTYARWFNDLPVRGAQGIALQKRIVGAARWSKSQKAKLPFGGVPEWQDLIEPETGELLSLDKVGGVYSFARRRKVDMQVYQIELALLRQQKKRKRSRVSVVPQ